MDNCRITKIENLKSCKKLQTLSLSGNLITDPSLQGGAQQLIDLKSLTLSHNKITQIKHFYGYPNLEELYLQSNPLSRVHPKASFQIKELQLINLSNCAFLNQHPDEFKFLKAFSNLKKLQMNQCFVESDFENIELLPGLFELEELELSNVGLLYVDGIEAKYPMLRYLDLSRNKIFSLQQLELICKLKKLTSLTVTSTPLMAHIELTNMIMEQAPQIEVINHERVRELGHKLK
jgi:Leucine-rich repeat (LRR) protein